MVTRLGTLICAIVNTLGLGHEQAGGSRIAARGSAEESLVANPKSQNPKKYRDAASVCNFFEALDSLG